MQASLRAPSPSPPPLRERAVRRGIFVAFLGTDGAGKSTLIEAVCDDLDRLGVAVIVQSFRPRLLPNIGRLFGRKLEGMPGPGRVGQPHLRRPSGAIGSLFRLAYYTADFAVGYWLRVRPGLRRGAVMLFHRYYYDFHYDPGRFRVHLPGWVVRFFEGIVPAPDLVLIARPAPRVFHFRKPELPLEEHERQARHLLALGGRLRNVVWIDTCGPVAESRRAVLDAVLQAASQPRRDIRQ